MLDNTIVQFQTKNVYFQLPAIAYSGMGLQSFKNAVQIYLT